MVGTIITQRIDTLILHAAETFNAEPLAQPGRLSAASEYAAGVPLREDQHRPSICSFDCLDAHSEVWRK